MRALKMQWQLGFLLLFCVTPSLCPASTVVRLSPEEMARRASHVLHGNVVAIDAAFTADGQQILTYVTLEVMESLKGPTSAFCTFAFLGGRVGDAAMVVVGAPRFAVGEEVVVDLVKMAPQRALPVETDLWLVGLGQGKWSVQRDRRGQTPIATVALGKAYRSRPGETIADTLPLAELRRRILRTIPGRTER